MVREADIVDVVEAAYRLEGDDPAWLRGVLEAARPGLDVGLGVMGYFVDARTLPARRRPWGHTALGVQERHLQGSLKLHAEMDPRFIDRLYVGVPPASTGSELAASPEDWEIFLRTNPGMGDALGLVCLDPGGLGCCIAVPLAEETRLAPRVRVRWARLVAHVTAGLRLRRGVDALREQGRPVSAEGHPGDAARGAPSAQALLDSAEAVLDPDGRIRHAEGPAKSRTAREALREAAVAQDRARGRLRRDDEALELWQGLVAGRWSLVDSFDRDGRRFLVARRNDPRLAASRTLTLRERQVAGFAALGHANKLIAYELGLSSSTVSAHLRRALVKLGLKHRLELSAVVPRDEAPHTPHDSKKVTG